MDKIKKEHILALKNCLEALKKCTFKEISGENVILLTQSFDMVAQLIQILEKPPEPPKEVGNAIKPIKKNK